jgi:hypothetical protein
MMFLVFLTASRLTKYVLAFAFIIASQSAIAESIVALDTGSVPSANVTAGKPFLLEFASGSVHRIDGRNGVDWTIDEENGVMKDIGKVIIEPMTEKPFTLLVTRDDGKSYQLEIKPVKNAGIEHIILKSALTGIDDNNADPQVMRNLSKAQTRDKTIRLFIEAMANDKRAKGLTLTTVNKPVSLWLETNIVETRTVKGMGMSGKVWELTNISDQVMTLDEREFFFENTAAAAIQKSVLKPGEMTRILMVLESAR